MRFYLLLGSTALLPLAAASQNKPTLPDSLRQTLSPTEIQGTRAAALDPVPFAVVATPRNDPAFAGQELPVYFQRTPSVISNAEAGFPFGYTNFRLRGIDQTRLNVTIDGIPLNEPEDQGAYFCNLPGFADLVASVQIQRGTGTTPNGTAPLGGSLNFLTTPPDGPGPHLQGSLMCGSFGTGRGSVGYRTGTTANGFAASLRGTYQRTDGYRTGGFNRSGSGFGAASWTGRRTVVRLLVLAGDARNGASYLPSPDTAIRRDRRHNPLTAAENDHFNQQLAGLTVSHAVGAHSIWTTTLYGIRLRGSYDVRFTPDLVPTFALASGWGGGFSSFHTEADRLTLDVGLHALRYARTHTFTDAGQEQYRNTGHWTGETVFTKVAWRFGTDPSGGLRAFVDLGVRHSGFRYAPDAAAGLQEAPRLDWYFFNPRAGLTWQRGATAVFASVGRTRREPTRNDLFAGADNLDAAQLASLGGLNSVKPESVTDYELGIRRQSKQWEWSATVFAMEFRNEIAAIGRLSVIGLPLRRNVDRSFRRGVELTAHAQLTPWFSLDANGTLLHARIRTYPDSTTGQTYQNVQPLLTPLVSGYLGPRVQLGEHVTLLTDVQLRSRAYLSNANDPRFRLPAAAQLDAGIRYGRGAVSVTALVNNITNVPYAAGGSTDGVRPYYFVLAPPNVFLTLAYAK